MTSEPPPAIRPLPDRWHSRDYPVLHEIARGLDAGALPDQDQIIRELGLSEQDIEAAWHALGEGGYLRMVEGRPRRLGDGEVTRVVLTERGLRAVGLWPSDQSGIELVDLLRQAADATTDPEERTILQRASGAVGSVSREVITDVVAALVKSQAGL